MLKRFFGIFKIQKEERLPALVALIAFIALNALNVVKYWSSLSDTELGFRNFIRDWHISGFDPITYSVLSDWSICYNL